MFYTIYKITNKIDGKIYIGCHKTEDPNDDYMGSGKYLINAQEKHGIENFEKEILEVFDNSEAMFEMESKLVNEDFVNRTDTYNLKEGGCGGFDYINNNVELRIKKNREAMKKAKQNGAKENSDRTQKYLRENDFEWVERYCKALRDGSRRFYENGGKGSFTGRIHTDETKSKMSEAKKGVYDGVKNPSYGTMWVHSLTEKVSKTIKKDEFSDWEAKGWLKGRKMKF